MINADDVQGVLVYVGPGAVAAGVAIAWRAARRRRAGDELDVDEPAGGDDRESSDRSRDLDAL